MFTQKIFRSGNSAVVAIPKELMRKLNWKIGTLVVIESNPKNKSIIVKKSSLEI